MKKQIILIIVSFSVIAVLASFFGRSSSELHNVEKIQVVTHWEELDLASIKKDYQSYTVAEMTDMWHNQLITKYGSSEEFVCMMQKVDNVYPRDLYLARLLELGRPFVDFSDYEDVLTEQRLWLFSMRNYWVCMNAAERGVYLEQHGLPPDAAWETYEEVLLKNAVVDSINFHRSIERDPYMNRTFENQSPKSPLSRGFDKTDP